MACYNAASRTRVNFITYFAKLFDKLVASQYLSRPMTETQALQELGIQAIETAAANWRAAWNDIRGQFNHPDHSNRIRSSLLQEHAAIHGKKTLPDYGVRYVNDETQHMFIFPNKACIIYKKLDENRRPHSTDTDRGRKLLQSELFNELPTLVIGMMTSQDFLSYSGIYMIHPNRNGNGNSWALDITNRIVAVDVNQLNILSIVDPLATETTPIKSPKFTPKYDPAKKTASAEGDAPSSSLGA